MSVAIREKERERDYVTMPKRVSQYCSNSMSLSLFVCVWVRERERKIERERERECLSMREIERLDIFCRFEFVTINVKAVTD